MKFWELVSVCRSQPASLQSVLRAPKWKQYQEAYANFSELVTTQNRAVLDQVLPDELVCAVLHQHTTLIYRSQGHLRVRPLSHNDESLTLLQVYQQYGGQVLEDVFEYGLAKV